MIFTFPNTIGSSKYPSTCSYNVNEPTLRNIPIEKIVLDLDNPRMYHHSVSGGGGGAKLTDEEIQRDIENHSETPELMKSIQAKGIREAIYVIPVSGDKFRVIEGNRRTVVMRKLSREGYTNPDRPDLTFDVIPAKVLPADTPEVEIFTNKVIWQTGKSVWGAYNVAAATYRMRHEFLMAIEDIAASTQKSVRDTKEALRAYENYLEYSQTTGDVQTSRFSFFSKDCPASVRRWLMESPENKSNYYEWINPDSGNHRIRSVATRGGLRDFKDVVQSEPAITEFTKNPDLSVEDALEIVRDADITKGRPWLKQIEKVSGGLNNLDDEEIGKIRDENYRPKLIALERAIRNVLEEM